MRATVISLICGVMLGVGLGGCGTGHKGGSPPASSGLQHLALTIQGKLYPYALYVPPGNGRRMPLVEVLHGCEETADQIAGASQFDALARRHRFAVLYPEVDAIDVQNERCWKAIWDPALEGRGRGDAEAIAAMTYATVRRWRIDPERIYAIGISAGALETAILAVDYPDVYAAIGLHSGTAYGGGGVGCLVAGESPASAGTLARAAVAGMGHRTRIVPVFIIHGLQDGQIPYRCGLEALQQWLATDRLAARRERIRSAFLTPPNVVHAAIPEGHRYTVVSYLERPGCAVAQMWTVDGMGHFWSGGSAKLPRYSDPKGPSATAAAWRFFSHWHLSGRSADC